MANKKAIKLWRKLQAAFKKGHTIVWNDPQPLKGNDYTVTTIINIPEEDIYADTPIYISYNGGGSEAEVLISELEIKKVKNKTIKQKCYDSNITRIAKELNMTPEQEAALQDMFKDVNSEERSLYPIFTSAAGQKIWEDALKKEFDNVFYSTDETTEHKRNKKRVVPDELKQTLLRPEDCFTKVPPEDTTFRISDYP